jgi:hypothetical protein
MFGKTGEDAVELMTADNAWTYWSRSDAHNDGVATSGRNAKARAGLARGDRGLPAASHAGSTCFVDAARRRCDDAGPALVSSGSTPSAAAIGDAFWKGSPPTRAGGSSASSVSTSSLGTMLTPQHERPPGLAAAGE